MKCPKCSYLRLAADTTPSYECPKCGVVYAKYEAKQDRLSPNKTEISQTDFKVRKSRNSNTVEVREMFRKYATISIIIIFLAVAAGFGLNQYLAAATEAKRVQAQAKLDAERKQVANTLVKWTDALELAGMTSRIALAQPISQMQSIRRELESLELDECTKAATKPMIEAMNNALFAFELFVRYPNSSSASSSTAEYLKNSTAQIKVGKQQIEVCAPISE